MKSDPVRRTSVLIRLSARRGWRGQEPGDEEEHFEGRSLRRCGVGDQAYKMPEDQALNIRIDRWALPAEGGPSFEKGGKGLRWGICP